MWTIVDVRGLAKRRKKCWEGTKICVTGLGAPRSATETHPFAVPSWFLENCRFAEEGSLGSAQGSLRSVDQVLVAVTLKTSSMRWSPS